VLKLAAYKSDRYNVVLECSMEAPCTIDGYKELLVIVRDFEFTPV